MTTQDIHSESSNSSTTTNSDKETKTSIIIAEINENKNNNKNDSDEKNNSTENDSTVETTNLWSINDTLDLKDKGMIKKLGLKNLSSSIVSLSTPNFSNEYEISSSSSSSPLSSPSTPPSKQKLSLITTTSLSETPPSLSSSSSLSSSPISSPSINNHVVSDLSNVENLPKRTRSVSFNKTVTFVPHVPTPSTKIRKKLSKEATLNQKDVVVEMEDLGKVRVNSKNGRVIKITPFVWPGPLNGDENHNDNNNSDNDVIMNNNDHSPRSSSSYDDDNDDDVLFITAVPITEKNNKLRIGKYIKRYYNKLIPQQLHSNNQDEEEEEEEDDDDEGEEEEEEQREEILA